MSTILTDCGVELPRYQCHKEVWALKIADIVHEKPPIFLRPTCRGCFAFHSACGHCERCDWERTRGPVLGAYIVPAEERYGKFYVDGGFLLKHAPQPGGYYVIYKDGYKSFSPAEAFEAGYTRVSA
jgi:hypothetical protein